MNVKQSAIAFAIAAALPLAAQAAPKVSFAAPLAGGTLSGNVQQNNRCEVKGSNDIRRVVFWLDGSILLNTEGNVPWTCNVDTRKYYDGAHKLKAMAYDSRGASTATEIAVNFSNGNPPPSTGGSSGGTTPSPTYSYSGTAYSGTPFAAPKAFAAVEFDRGGQSVAYSDRTSGNSGGEFRAEGVDIVAVADSLSSYTVNNFQTGEWLAYSVNVANPGKYDLAVRAAHNYAATPAFHIEVDGVDVTGRISVPKTGGWGTYQWIGKQDIELAAGKRIVKVVADAEYFNMNGVSVLASASSGGGSTPTEPPPTGGTTPPSGLSVAFDAPRTGDTLSSVLNQSSGCQVSGSGIARVEFSLDPTALNQEGSAPWQCNLDPTLFPVGTHKLKAKAFNSSGASVETTVDIATTGGSTGSGGGTGGGSGSKPAGMIFWSGFDGVTPGTPYDCYANGCYQDIEGTDAKTGFAWPPKLGGGTGKFQLLVNGGPYPTPTNVYGYMKNEIQSITGPKGTPAKALYSHIEQSGCCGTDPQGSHSTQNPYLVLPSTEVPEAYVSTWVKLQPDLAQKLWSGDSWRPLFELKTADDDWRLTIGASAFGGAQPYWDVQTNTYVPSYKSYWRVTTAGQRNVPVGQWFKLEVYWKRSTGTDGRIWVAVDGQVIADRTGSNMGPNRTRLNRIFLTQLYSGSPYPIYQWLTDVQIWSTFPTAAAGEAWYNPPYAPR